MSREVISTIVDAFGTLTLFGQVLLLFLVLLFGVSIMIKKERNTKKLLNFISQNGLSFAFLVAAVATIGSLFFSEIGHFIPCKLCWYQRIFMYPQAIILGIATVRNDLSVVKYLIPLSIVGGIIALYHYILQMAPFPLPCTDEIASCAAKQFAQYGYITIPLMSLTAFFLILFFLFASMRVKK